MEENRNGRIVGSEHILEDKSEITLRPKWLSDFIGQNENKERLGLYINAAKMREETLDHVLLQGPPGLGKTTLSTIIANEMGVNVKITSGPAIQRQGDMASILTNLKEGDVLFIDEIHRINRSIEEILYSAMEDFKLDLMVGKGTTAQSIRINLNKFTLIGATTRAGMLSNPLRDRFGVLLTLDLYEPVNLAEIIKRSAEVLEVNIDDDAAFELASRSRGTPRIANRLLKRVRDYAQVLGDGVINLKIARDALEMFEIDELGLDKVDSNLMLTIINNFGGGPVGLDTLAASIGEDSVTIQDVYEPYLLRIGFINRTPRGRVATSKAYKHYNIKRDVD